MPHKRARQQAFQHTACQTDDCDEQWSICQNASHAGCLTIHAIVQKGVIISPVEVRQFQVGAGGIKTLFGNFVVVN